MIKQIAYIQNVGRFERVHDSTDTSFSALTLIYSENGRGKTTLCSIVRSFSSGDARFIKERRRLSDDKGESRVVLDVDGKQSVFAKDSWSTIAPRILIFDDHFVDTNIYSGLSVEAEHRKNIHELAIGEEGVKHQRLVEELTETISALQTAVREKSQALRAHIRETLSVDEFCALPRVPDLDDVLDEAKRAVAVLTDSNAVKAAKQFEAFALAAVDVAEIEKCLSASLTDLEREAAATVRRHVALLGNDSEEWISKGMSYAAGRSECPFCGQELSAATLVGHYQAYFSAAYEDHKRSMAALQQRIAADLGGDALARFQGVTQEAKDRARFWGKYFAVPEVGIDAPQLASTWKATRDHLVATLKKKATTPLEPVALGEDAKDALRQYQALAAQVSRISSAVLECNQSVRLVKEKATYGDLAAAQAHLSRLQTTKRRYDPEIDILCRAYLEATAEKTRSEGLKETARAALDKQRGLVFPKYQTVINKFLVRFNAGFTVDRLEPTDPRGQPSSSYGLVINRKHVPLSPNTDEPTPSFRNTLSSGDRNTIALAFFFASLEACPSLQDTVVIIDDPASSLDDGRTVATAQEIRSLCGRAKQVVVLSHSKELLCEIWAHADRGSSSTLQIRDVGPEASTIVSWNAHADSITEYDRRHALLRLFVENADGEPRDIAVSLRLVLEGFLRIACVEHFPPGKPLGPFINECRQAAQVGSPRMPAATIDELDKLREYANRFHHDTNEAWQQEISNINETQLKGFTRRVLSFTQVIRSATPGP